MGAFLFALLFVIVKDCKISDAQLLTIGKNYMPPVVNDYLFFRYVDKTYNR